MCGYHDRSCLLYTGTLRDERWVPVSMFGCLDSASMTVTPVFKDLYCRIPRHPTAGIETVYETGCDRGLCSVSHLPHSFGATVLR